MKYAAKFYVTLKTCKWGSTSDMIMMNYKFKMLKLNQCLYYYIASKGWGLSSLTVFISLYIELWMDLYRVSISCSFNKLIIFQSLVMIALRERMFNFHLLWIIKKIVVIYSPCFLLQFDSLTYFQNINVNWSLCWL